MYTEYMHIQHPFLFLLLFLVGILTGIYSSVVGGGAIITVPLFTFLGVPLPAAIATMRLSSVIQQFTALLAFSKERDIEWKVGLWTGLWCIPSAYLGAMLTLRISVHHLSYAIAVIMVLLLIATFKLDLKKIKQRRKLTAYHWPLLAIAGIVLGFYGGFYGAGFSTMLMFIFILTGTKKLIQSSADASVAAFMMACAASVLFWHAHLLRWELFIPITLGGMIGSWCGVEWAAKFGMNWIKSLLVFVVIISAIKLLFFS